MGMYLSTVRNDKQQAKYGTLITITSLNGSHNGSKNYAVDSLSRNRCQRPLTNCYTGETPGKDGGEMTLDLTIFSIFICP